MTETRDATIRILSSLSEIGKADWDRLAGSDNPFVSHDFLWSLEESGSATARTGWRPAHLVLEGPDGPGGAVPAYLKTHSQGEYVFDHGWADAFERAGGDYYPKLQVSVPFTPASGPRLLVPAGAAQDGTRKLLAAALGTVGERIGASSVHATFLDDADEAALREAGWLIRHDQQFHWFNKGYGSFDDFLAEFRSDKRKQVKRERREAVGDGITIEALTGADITEAHWDAFFRFYMDTGARKWGQPYLNRKFYALIGARMPDRILLVLAKREGRYIAGALNFIGADTLYGRYWGAIEQHPFLHFELCYHQAVDFAIARKLSRVEAGAQGDHKIARGYVPVTTRSAHHIVDPGFHAAIEHYLERERRQVARMKDMLEEQLPFRRGEVPGASD